MKKSGHLQSRDVFIEPSQIGNGHGIKRPPDKVCFCGGFGLNPLKVIDGEHSREGWVCRYVWAGLLLDWYRFYTSDTTATLTVCHLPGNRQVDLSTEDVPLFEDEDDQVAIVTVHGQRSLDPLLWCSWQSVVGFNYFSVPPHHSLEMLLDTPTRFGPYYVVGCDNMFLMIGRHTPRDTQTLFFSTLSALLSSTECSYVILSSHHNIDNNGSI